MEQVQECFKQEIEKITRDVLAAGGDFRFAVVADSHLDNSISKFLANISAVDNAVNFDCMLHLGDFLNGSLSERYTRKILKEQIELYESAIKADFYPAQGNHDGFSNLKNPRTHDILPDELWKDATGREPCYYIDYEEQKIRLVCVCSYDYTYENGVFDKIYGVRHDTIKWLYEEALNVENDWTVIIFSHDSPFTEFPVDNIDETEYYVNGREQLDAVVRAKEERGFDIAAWFIGHRHDDFEQKLCGINFIMINSQTAYIATLWDTINPQRNGKYFAELERNIGTVTEDLWDAVVLDKKERKIKLFRFGAGIDREVEY